MKQIRKRLTYANVMSSIAIFLVLGGATAFAAKKIGANEIKANSIKTGKIVKEAVTTSKIKQDAVTGAKVNESTLGTVPSATNAATATNAGNANTVGGQSVVKIFSTLTEGQSNVSIATVGGFNFVASCKVNNADLAVNAPVGPGTNLLTGGEIQTGNVTTFDWDNAKAGEGAQIRVDEESGGGDTSYGIATVDLATQTGTVVSGVLNYEWDAFSSSNICLISGHLLVG